LRHQIPKSPVKAPITLPSDSFLSLFLRDHAVSEQEQLGLAGGL